MSAPDDVLQWADRPDERPQWTGADVTAIRRLVRDELDIMRGETDGQISARWGWALPFRSPSATARNREDWSARLAAVTTPAQRVMVESGGRNGRKTGSRTPTVPLWSADGTDLEDLFSADESAFCDLLAFCERSWRISRAASSWTIGEGDRSGFDLTADLIYELADRLGYGPYALDLLRDGPADDVATAANGVGWEPVDVGPDDGASNDPGLWAGLLEHAEQIARGPVAVTDRSPAALDLTPETARWEIARRAANRIGKRLGPAEPWPERLVTLAAALGIDAETVDRRGWAPVQARCRAAFEAYAPELTRIAESESTTEMSEQ